MHYAALGGDESKSFQQDDISTDVMVYAKFVATTKLEFL